MDKGHCLFTTPPLTAPYIRSSSTKAVVHPHSATAIRVTAELTLLLPAPRTYTCCVKMKTCVVLFSVYLPVIMGQVFHWGPCPDPAVQPNFNLHMYFGKWYEIEKLPASFEKGKCIETNYSLRADGTIKVLNTEVVKGVTHSIEGTAVIQDINQPAKLGVSFSFFTPYSPYWVLSTDYETSAVVYSCIDIVRIFRVEYAWILGRTRSLPEMTISGSKDILIGSNIDISRMTPTDQEGCDKVI
ncbi:apolipoprotein D-like isoform X1 [Arapaima gigas]